MKVGYRRKAEGVPQIICTWITEEPSKMHIQNNLFILTDFANVPKEI